MVVVLALSFLFKKNLKISKKALDVARRCLHCEYMKGCPQYPSVASRRVPTRPSASQARPEAFTLIELLVVIAIIAILAGLTLSTLGYVNRKGAESRAKTEVAALSAAIESYKLDYGTYPTNTNASQLYRELTGSGTVNSNKVYIEPTLKMTTNLTAGPFLDPWGTAYVYRVGTGASNNPGFFDIISYAGNSAASNSNNWIRN